MSQRLAIKGHLLKGKKISPLQALRDFGCMRLADVIWKLRREGMDIETDTRDQGGKVYAVYRINPIWLERFRRAEGLEDAS